jgi:hypothetical protein
LEILYAWKQRLIDVAGPDIEDPQDMSNVEQGAPLEDEEDPSAMHKDGPSSQSSPDVSKYIKDLTETLNSADTSDLKTRVSKGYFWHHPPHPLFVSAKAKKNNVEAKDFCYPTVRIDCFIFFL